MYLDSGHDPAGDIQLLNRVLQGDGVDDSRQHAHVVGRYAVHVDGLLGYSPEEVAAPDHDADLTSEPVHIRDLRSYLVNDNGIDTKARAPCKGFP